MKALVACVGQFKADRLTLLLAHLGLDEIKTAAYPEVIGGCDLIIAAPWAHAHEQTYGVDPQSWNRWLFGEIARANPKAEVHIL